MKRTSTFSAAGAQPNARGPKCRSMQNISKDNSEKEKPVMTEKNDNEGTPSDSTSVKLSDRPFGELSYEERRQALEEVDPIFKEVYEAVDLFFQDEAFSSLILFQQKVVEGLMKKLFCLFLILLGNYFLLHHYHLLERISFSQMDY